MAEGAGKPAEIAVEASMPRAAETVRRRRSATRFLALLRTSLHMAWEADRRLLVACSALQLLGGLIALAQILIIKDLLVTVLAVGQPGGSINRTVLPVSLLALAISVSTVSSAVQQQWQRLLAELVTRRVWDDILDVTASLDLRQFDSPDFYDRLQLVQAKAVSRPFMLTRALVSLIGSVFSSVGVAVAVASVQPVLLPMLLVSGIPLYLGTREGGNLEFAFAVAQTPAYRLREYLRSIQVSRDEAKEIRAFGIAPTVRGRYERAYSAYLEDLRTHVRRRSMVALASSLGSALILAATILAIVWMVARHQVSLAGAGAAIVAVRLLAAQVTSALGSVGQMSESGLFLDDLHRFVASPAVSDDDGGEPAPSGFETLEVEDVSFSYPGSDRPAVQGVNLRLAAGETVALVGENGSGKTTLAKLLAALYRPGDGTIRWDGVDLSHYSQASIRRSVAVVFQDFVRYQLPAGTNIAFGRPDGDERDPEILRSARRSGAARFIENLPAGYDTVLSKAFAGGHEPSGGEWQRVALARAFYRDAPFVILDEPSASLDPRAEHELFESLRQLLAGRTVLYISHRLSTVRSADRIYVMAEGEVVEHGSHDELMSLGGRYAELFALQATAYLDGSDAPKPASASTAPARPGGNGGPHGIPAS